MPLPACAYNAIRSTFSSANESDDEMTGFVKIVGDSGLRMFEGKTWMIKRLNIPVFVEIILLMVRKKNKWNT